MFNFLVPNLDRVLAELKQEGVWVDPKTEETPDGKFGWIMDCEGNRIELWEPAKPDLCKLYERACSRFRGKNRLQAGSYADHLVAFLSTSDGGDH
jgi:hypothetical protein